MATQLGKLRIDVIETDDDALWVRGVYTSLHDRDVYRATREAGATILFEARESLGLPELSEAALLEGIDHVHFSTPNTQTTQYSICVLKPEIAEGLKPMAWDSYRLG